MTAPLDAARFEAEAVTRVDDALDGVDLAALRASLDLIRASTRLVQQLERRVHRPAGWSMAGFRIMFCVWVAGELEPRDIAHVSGLSRAAVSSALNTLERDALIERSRESHDRRLVTVRLTEAGRRGVTAAYAAQNQVERAFFGDVDPDDLETFTRALRAMLTRRLPTGTDTDTDPTTRHENEEHPTP